MVVRLLLSLLVATLLLCPKEHASAAAAAWAQDELVKQSDVIAVVDIHERVFSTINGAVLDHDGKEFPTALILYSSSVVDILYGRIAKEPLIIQFDGAGDRSPLEKGRYLLFLKSEGYLFTPMETYFRIDHEKVFWFTKPFLRGGYGPEMGEVPLDKAIPEVKGLIEKYKKS